LANWELIKNEDAAQIWDQTLIGFADYSPYQSYDWGEYRRALGWEPYRLVARDDENKIVAMMQGTLQRHPFSVGLMWCEGGPIGDLAACDGTLQKAAQEATGLKRVYCRFRCDRGRNIEDVLRLSGQGWRSPWSPITSNYSMTLDPSQDEDRLLAACDRNFRRNLRRATETKLRVTKWFKPNVDEVLAIYASMQGVKGIEEQLSREEIEQMLNQLKDRLVIYRCEDQEGNVVSLLGVFIVGDKATSLLWATSEKGRELLASYPIFWSLLQHCRNAGVRTFDLAGVDPIRNHGVYRFKRATGAQPIEYLGEWDWGSSTTLRLVGNWAVEQRDTIKKLEGILRPRRRKPARGIAAANRSITAATFAADEGMTHS
jgi:lipid II:glycine glycyltransferase (peptidoglycan interpeptide bridge formation enzyme)